MVTWLGSVPIAAGATRSYYFDTLDHYGTDNAGTAIFTYTDWDGAGNGFVTTWDGLSGEMGDRFTITAGYQYLWNYMVPVYVGNNKWHLLVDGDDGLVLTQINVSGGHVTVDWQIPNFTNDNDLDTWGDIVSAGTLYDRKTVCLWRGIGGRQCMLYVYHVANPTDVVKTEILPESATGSGMPQVMYYQNNVWAVTNPNIPYAWGSDKAILKKFYIDPDTNVASEVQTTYLVLESGEQIQFDGLEYWDAPLKDNLCTAKGKAVFRGWLPDSPNTGNYHVFELNLNKATGDTLVCPRYDSGWWYDGTLAPDITDSASGWTVVGSRTGVWVQSRGGDPNTLAGPHYKLFTFDAAHYGWGIVL